MSSKTLQRVSILSAVGAGTLLGSGGWHVLQAFQASQTAKEEEAAIEAALKSISKSVTNSEAVLIALETQQRQVEQDLVATEATLAALRSKVQEAERTQQALFETGSRLAEDIKSETHVLQGLVADRTDREAALVVSIKQREEDDMRLAKAKEQWWVTRLL